MPILQIDTYDRTVFEAAMPFTDADLNDRTDFATLPRDMIELCKYNVANGKMFPERQPDDGVVFTDNTVVVTLTWMDQTAAEEYVAEKLARAQSNNLIGLISSVVEVR